MSKVLESDLKLGSGTQVWSRVCLPYQALYRADVISEPLLKGHQERQVGLWWRPLPRTFTLQPHVVSEGPPLGFPLTGYHLWVIYNHFVYLNHLLLFPLLVRSVSIMSRWTVPVLLNPGEPYNFTRHHRQTGVRPIFPTYRYFSNCYYLGWFSTRRKIITTHGH